MAQERISHGFNSHKQQPTQKSAMVKLLPCFGNLLTAASLFMGCNFFKDELFQNRSKGSLLSLVAKVLSLFVQVKSQLLSTSIFSSFLLSCGLSAASPHALYEFQGNSLVCYILTLTCKRFSAPKPEHLLSFLLGFGPSFFTDLDVALLFSSRAFTFPFL